ncbi:copper resistance protein B, partial [Pseudomonas sp. MAFF 301449]
MSQRVLAVCMALVFSPLATAEEEFQGMSPAVPALTESRTPIPVLTDADRAAVYHEPGGHRVHDSAVHSMLLLNQLEWQGGEGSGALNWDAKGWIGGDVDRLWLRSEGERSAGRTDSAEAQALWGHAISPWWDLV